MSTKIKFFMEETMEEKVQIQIETTKQELINKAYHLLTAISELADNINCMNFGKDPADLEADALKYTYSIKALSETAQTLLFHVNGEL